MLVTRPKQSVTHDSTGDLKQTSSAQKKFSRSLSARTQQQQQNNNNKPDFGVNKVDIEKLRTTCKRQQQQ